MEIRIIPRIRHTKYFPNSKVHVLRVWIRTQPPSVLILSKVLCWCVYTAVQTLQRPLDDTSTAEIQRSWISITSHVCYTAVIYSSFYTARRRKHITECRVFWANASLISIACLNATYGFRWYAPEKRHHLLRLHSATVSVQLLRVRRVLCRSLKC